MESKKNDIDKPICRKGMEMQIQKMDSDTTGKGESGMNGESSTNIYILPSVKQMSGEQLL